MAFTSSYPPGHGAQEKLPASLVQLTRGSQLSPPPLPGTLIEVGTKGAVSIGVGVATGAVATGNRTRGCGAHRQNIASAVTNGTGVDTARGHGVEGVVAPQRSAACVYRAGLRVVTVGHTKAQRGNRGVVFQRARYARIGGGFNVGPLGARCCRCKTPRVQYRPGKAASSRSMRGVNAFDHRRLRNDPRANQSDAEPREEAKREVREGNGQGV